jgi:phospholipase/carboxylesterase
MEQATEQLSINRCRIFLAGFGCGGTMALRVAMDNPHRFAGALSLDGSFPRGQAPLQRLIEARQMPLFIARARQSRNYGEEIACDDLRLLYAAGMSLTLKEYPGANVCRPQVLADIDRWIMEVLAEQNDAAVVASARRL